MADAVNFNRKSLIVTSLVVACLALFYYQWKGYGSAASKQEPVGKQSAHLTPGDSYTPGDQLPQATLHAHQQAQHSRPPQRTLDRLARPGPMPGSRPSPGGPGSLVQPQPKGSGVLSIIMPVYSVGIVIFFVYTVIKVVSRRNSSAHTGPRRSCSMTDGATINTLRHSTTAAAAAAAASSSRPLQSAAPSRQQQQQQQQCHPTECCKNVASAVTTATTGPTTDVPATRAAGHDGTQVSNDDDDVEIDELRRRLEETEKAMELIMSQLGNVSAKLVTAKQQQQQQGEEVKAEEQGEEEKAHQQQQQQQQQQGEEQQQQQQGEDQEEKQQQEEDKEESVKEQQQSSSEDLHQQTALKCDGGDVVPDQLDLPVTAGLANNSVPENCAKDNSQHPAVATPFGEPELVSASAESSVVEHLSAAENGTKHATSVATDH